MSLYFASLTMRNKGLIITNDLSPSFCQFVLSFLLPGNKRPEIRSVFSGVLLFHQSILLFHKLKFNASDAPQVSVYRHCGHYLSLKHSISKSLCTLPPTPQPNVLITKHSQRILMTFIECTMLAHIKTLNQFHSHLVFHLAFCLATLVFLDYHLFITSLGYKLCTFGMWKVTGRQMLMKKKGLGRKTHWNLKCYDSKKVLKV